MADNTAQNGTATFVAEDTGSGVLVEVAKVTFGAHGTYTNVTGTTPLPVQPQVSSSASITSYSPLATSGQVLAANTSRRGAMFFNDSNVDVLLSFGATSVSTTSYTVRVYANGYYELPAYWQGAVQCVGVAAGTTTVSAAGTGALRVTEVS